MQHEGLEFLPAWVSGKVGLVDVARKPREPDEERWLITMAHQPQSLAWPLIPTASTFLTIGAKNWNRKVGKSGKHEGTLYVFPPFPIFLFKIDKSKSRRPLV